MPKGNKTGEKNLIPIMKRSKEERVRIASMGGKRLAEIRKQQKTFREMFKVLLNADVPTELLPKKMQELTGREISFLEAIALAAASKAVQGDVSAAAFVRDTIGEKPKDKVEMDGDFEIKVKIED